MATELRTILKLSVPVLVQVGERHLAVDDVLALAPGAIIELEKPAESELDLLVNNKPIAKGSAVKVGENFGLKVAHIGTAHQRVEALAQ